MAAIPQPPNPDPNRIDVSLSLINDQSLSVANDLVQQLRTVTEHLVAVQQLVPEAAQQGAARVARRTAAGVYEGGRSPTASFGAAPPVEDAHGRSGSYAADVERGNESFFRSRLPRYLVNPTRIGQHVDNELSIYAASEREQAQRRSPGRFPYNPVTPSLEAPHNLDLDLQATRGYSPGGVSASASIPDGPAWLQARMANPNHAERMWEAGRLPQFGELTTQNKLEWAGDALARFGFGAWRREEVRRAPVRNAIRQYTDLGFSHDQAVQALRQDPDFDTEALDRALGPNTSGQLRGRTAGLLQQAADASAQITVARNEMRRLVNYGGGIQDQGVQAGYQRAGQINIPGTNIGITNPFDLIRGVFGGDSDGGGAAVAEGVQQRINTQRLRLMGGINKEQAEQIVGGLASMGWIGELGQNAAFDAIAPLVQQGLDPTTTIEQFDQAIRHGNTSLEDFRETLDDLGPAAQAARMSLQQYQQSLSGFAEQATGSGATFGQGMRLGRDISTATGLAPQVAGDLLFNSPLAQGMAMQQGLLPNEIGLMGGGQGTQTIMGALAYAEQATAGWADQDIEGPNGEVIRGSDRQNAQIATLLGTTPDVVGRLRNNRQQIETAGRASARLRTYSEFTDATIHERRRHPQSRQGSYTGRTDVNAILGNEDPVAEEYREESASAQRRLDRQWQGIRQDIIGLAPDRRDKEARSRFDKRVHELDSMPDARRDDAARMLIEDRQREIMGQIPDDRLTVKVEFIGDAARYFRQKEAPKFKSDAQAGGPPTTASLTSPQAARDAASRVYGIDVGNP